MGLLDGALTNVLESLAGGAGAGSSQSSLGALLNSLGSGNEAQSTNLLNVAMSMLQQNGGLMGVLDKFRQNGMAQHAESWVGTGDNMPITGDQLHQVFGDSSMASVASQLGQSRGQASSMMAQLLPELINHLTPQGQIPQDHEDMISRALGMLRGAMV
jgi:uncharacterized protein YidB (DUF937 family)